MLREHGYHTHWFGKWHLTHRDNRWTPLAGSAALEQYGFSGGVYPVPGRRPRTGLEARPATSPTCSRNGSRTPTTSSPGARRCRSSTPTTSRGGTCGATACRPRRPRSRSRRRLPPNYETPELLHERRKPRLQRSFQETSAASFGAVPFTGAEVPGKWLEFLDLYIKLQREVDGHIGHVLRTLHSRPEVEANTVIVFTSDHGEYGASHGLRGKGASAYEEALRVPLIVKDPREVLTAAPAQTRTQLTSSVDVAPMLLTIASGSSAWRHEHHYAHLANRLDLTELLKDPGAPGREYVLHATDEIVTEYAVETYIASAPLHVVAIRTPEAKYATYSNWPAGRDRPRASRARKPSCTTTAPRTGAWRSTTAPNAATSKSACGPCTSTPSSTSSASPSRVASSPPTPAASPTTS